MSNKASEMRDKVLRDKMKFLLTALDNADLTYAKMEGYGDNQTREKVEHWGDTVTVFAPDDRIVATVGIQTTRGWYSNFESYKLKVPTYQPRGDYHTRYKAREPANPAHWGWGNMKGVGTVIDKIKAALDSLPSAADIEVGKLRHKLDNLSFDLRNAKSERTSTFRSREVMDEVYGALDALRNKGHVFSDRVLKNMNQYDAACRSQVRVEKKRKKLWAKIDELEEK